MRRFLVIALILALLVMLAGSMTGNVFLYFFHQQEKSQTNGLLAVRSTRVAGLESELGDMQTQLREAVRQIETLQAYVEAAPPPTRTPPTQPVVMILEPLPGAQFTEGESVLIRWSAYNPDRVDKVLLRIDGVDIDRAEGNRESWVEGEFIWVAAGAGSHRVEILATNPVGAESDPARVVIKVVPSSESEYKLDPEIEETMDIIESQVAVLRGLEPLSPVTRTLMTVTELRKFLQNELDEDLSPTEARNTALEMAAFDFVKTDIDLRSLMEDLYTEQIAGFYDSDTQSFTVIDDNRSMSPLEKTTYAHEFTHALQDQYFGLEKIDPEDNTDDASLAATALIEGDAVLLMQQYMMDYLDSDELFDLLSESMETESDVLDSAPMVIQEQMLFPYEEGTYFAQALYEDGGYQAIDDALRNPPLSTEQILHPERYQAGELPVSISLPPLTDTLGLGWQWVDSDVLGEFTLRLYLEQQVQTESAESAADGWGGDRYTVYYQPSTDALVMVLRISWDNVREADEFSKTFADFAGSRAEFAPVRGGCWEGDDFLCLLMSGQETLILRAPDGELIEEIETLFPEFTPK